jgi:hypothetical protein
MLGISKKQYIIPISNNISLLYGYEYNEEKRGHHENTYIFFKSNKLLLTHS